LLIFDRVLDVMSTNKLLREQGRDINIPIPFPRMGRYLPGIQKGRYYIVTANSKVFPKKYLLKISCFYIFKRNYFVSLYKIQKYENNE
jgi:hypothetical protein